MRAKIFAAAAVLLLLVSCKPGEQGQTEPSSAGESSSLPPETTTTEFHGGDVTFTKKTEDVTTSGPEESSSASDGTSEAPPPVTTTAPPVVTTSQPSGSLLLPVPVPAFELNGLTERQAEEFYADAVFVGDSISMHWRNHVLKNRTADAGFFKGAQFLTSGSLGAGNSLWPLGGDSVHPAWEGEPMQLWNSIPLTGAKKVILMFGLNDVGMYGVEKTVINFDTLIGKIRETTPDAEFYIISATYVRKGGEKGGVKTENLRKLNNALIEYCVEKQIPFINLADALADTDGNLKAEYCNDGYVHHTSAAHLVWEKVLRGFAANR